MPSTAPPAGWHVALDGLSYPPEPWHLQGRFVVSTFVVPRRRVGASLLEAFPGRLRPIALGGRAVFGVAFVDYGPGGALSYRELLVAMPTLSRRGLRYTIPRIWVDSPQSLRGGRELWGIPKELAEFTWEETGADMNAAMRIGPAAIASVHARGFLPLPGTWSIPLPTAQRVEDGAIFSRNLVRARVGLTRAHWSFATDGPLGFLAGIRPVMSLRFSDAAVNFGVKVERWLAR